MYPELVSRVAQYRQKFEPSLFSAPQLGHCIRCSHDRPIQAERRLTITYVTVNDIQRTRFRAKTLTRPAALW